VKQRTKSRPSIGPLKDGDGMVVTDDKAMADLLNRSFKSIFTRKDMSNVPVPEDMQPRTALLTVDFC
jgi:uncharacterized HAD superfamily protein